LALSTENLEAEDVAFEVGDGEGDPREPSGLEIGRAGSGCCPVVAADLAGLAATKACFLGLDVVIVLFD
jgi:hypothetical protein